MIDSLSSENEFPWNWGRWRLLVACGRVVEGVVFLEYSIGGIGCLGATDLAHCLARVLTTCALFRIGFSAGFSLNFQWILVSSYVVHIWDLVVQVVCPCFLGFPGCLARIVGGFYLDSCPGCGLKLAMAGLLVVMLGRPVCGVFGFDGFVSG